MGYIVDHEIIKSWNMYKSMIYIKDGQHIGPLSGLNVVYYIKPLTNLKNAQGSPKKRDKTQRYRYSASLLSNKDRCKNRNLQSGYSGEFLLLFGKE